MESIKISVSGNLTSVISVVPVVAGTVGLTVEFSFDPTWAALKKTAVFRVGSKTRDVLDAGELVTVPWELLQNPGCRLWAGVYGSNVEGNLQIPTVWADLGIIQPGADPSGDESADPTLPVWEQVCRETVQCVPQNLTPEQQAQVRDNIGAAAVGENGGYVVIQPTEIDGDTANMNSEQIFQYIANGGTCYLALHGILFPFGGGNIDSVWFVGNVAEKLCVIKVDKQAIISVSVFQYVTEQQFQDAMGEIENVLDSVITVQKSLIGGTAE